MSKAADYQVNNGELLPLTISGTERLVRKIDDGILRKVSF